jgi:DNA-binding HxlR family transcriptional regulator
MTVIHVHHEGLTGGSVISRAFAWLGAGFKSIHQAIVTAKLERLESELVVRRGYSDDQPSQRDVVRYPQRPLVLSDKWDF